MSTLEFSSFYSFEFRDSICLSDDWQWKGSWTMNLEIYPTGEGTYKAIIEPTDLILKNEDITGLNQLQFDAYSSDNILNWLFVIKSSESSGKYIGNIRCTDSNSGVDQTYQIEGAKLINSFYIPPYNN